MISTITRAFTSKLRQISPTAAESGRLQAAGVAEPTVQAFFLWRHSLVSVVVLATILSAGLATYREWVEDDTQPDAIEIQIDKLLNHAKSQVPMATGLLKVADSQVAAVTEKMDEDGEDEGDEPPAQAAKESSEDDDKKEPQTAFAQLAAGVDLLSLYILPLAALAALSCWTNFRLSSRIILAGWAFSFFVPMLFAFCPWEWYETPRATSESELTGLASLRLITRDVKELVSYLVTLLPAVLSLIPGIQKACLKVKMLLPESVLPGWFLVAASPFYSLLLLVIFIAFYQAAGEPLLLVGMLLFIAAPFLYIVQAKDFTRPLLTEDDVRRMRRSQQMITAVTAVAGLLLLYFILTQEMFGIRVIGLDAKSSLLTPLDLVEFGVEIIGRSMFMMVLGADLFMRMNLAAWRNQRDLAASPAAARYDSAMGALEQVA